MEKTTMFITCKSRHETEDRWVYRNLLARPALLKNQFLVDVRNPEKESQAADDAFLMTLANGAPLPGKSGVWQRIEPPIYYTPQPTHCDLTGALLGTIMFDGKTRTGQFAIMSNWAWETMGCRRLGTGYAQKYLTDDDGKFYLSEGGVVAPKPYRPAAA